LKKGGVFEILKIIFRGLDHKKLEF